MSSYLVAKGVGQSVNGDNYEVRIVRTAAGTDLTTEFTLASNGFALKYESVEDGALLPGIVHSRCEVVTLWPNAIKTKLDQLLTALSSSQDGDYLLEILHDSNRLWVGSILVEEFTVDEDSTVQEVRITATDAISLLRHVDYNNSGAAYTGYQTVDTILKNIQEKWSCYSYLNSENSGTEYRIAWAEDVYSDDDYIMAGFGHPAGTNKKSIQRSRIHANPWTSTNSAGIKEYTSTYDVLMSLCITYQWRLYSHGDGWHFIPVRLSGERTPGNVLQWDGTVVDRDVNAKFEYQKTLTDDTRQKDGGWRVSFTPPVNEVRLTRDTLDGNILLYGTDDSLPQTYTDTVVTYEGADTADDDSIYNLQASFRLDNTALSLDGYPYGQVVLKYTIKFDDAADAQYYKNTIEENSGVLQSVATSAGIIDYTPAVVSDAQYSSSVSFYYNVPGPVEFGSNYLVNYDGSRVFNSNIVIPPPPTQKQGLSITVDYDVYDENLSLSSTYKAATTLTCTSFLLLKFDGDQLELVDDYDIVASADAGRKELNLGTTMIGDRGFSGAVEVQTSAGVYSNTQSWQNQAVDDARSINTLAVEEVLQMHNNPKGVERGTLVLRGSNAAIPNPFAFYKDNDSGNFYAPINYQLNATACEVDITLRKTGRDAISVTTQEQNTGKNVTPLPGSDVIDDIEPVANTRGFNAQAADIFAQDWSSLVPASETVEAYYTVLPDGTGLFTDHQGESPATGYTINRKIYFRTLGLHEASDSGWVALPTNQPDPGATLEQAFVNVDLYMSALSGSSYSFLITYKEEADTLLQGYTGSTAAYSLRKISSTYTGNCVRVRRSSDSQTQDIGFSGDSVDTSAISTFCGSGSGYVVIWYDQSGNGRNAQNFSTAEQPTIFSAGSMVTDNGKPAMEFDGSNDYLKTTATWPQNPNGALNFAVVCNTDSFSAGQYVFNAWTTSSSTQVWAANFMTNSKFRHGARYTNNQFPRTDSQALSTGTQYIAVSTFDGATTLTYYNGVEEDDKFGQSTSGVDPRNSTLAVAIGARQSDGGLDFNGKIQECIVWSNATAHNADDIGDAMNEYYSAY